MKDNSAIRIQSATKFFDNGNVKVLQNFNLSVPRSSIYTLLSSSGSGKSTILACILGLLKLDRGRISVFGRSDISNIRHLIGYMPQETALYDNFSIKETLVYFGRLFVGDKKGTSYFLERVDFLQRLLSLPRADKIVGKLSGGQQRRVSFAVALVHEPHIVLLDEPTTGVDPLIRECLWDYLQFLVREKGTTILLTTHYVDEANRSDVVGILRHGVLLAEESPKELVQRLHVNTLDDAFLHLCKGKNLESIPIPNNKILETSPTFLVNKTLSLSNKIQRAGNRILVIAREWRLFYKNIWVLGLMLTAPLITTLIVGYAFNNDLQGIYLNVVNQDYKNCSGMEDYVCEPECLSSIFLDSLSSKIIDLTYFQNVDKAKESVVSGNSYGVIHIPQNFSNNLSAKLMDGDSSPVSGSTIAVNLDQTSTILFFSTSYGVDMLVYSTIVKRLYESFESSAQKILRQCGFNERITEHSLKYLEPVVGRKEMKDFHYLAPGLFFKFDFSMSALRSSLFLLSLQISILVIKEKREGTMSRCLAGGVKMSEFLIACIIQDIPIVLFQCILPYLALYYGFSLGAPPLTSPLNLLVVCGLGMTLSLCGILYGFTMGLLCSTESQAAIILVSVMIPLSIISGIFWPREGMHKVSYWISYLSPVSLPLEAGRSLLTRPNEFYHDTVWQGSVSLLFYILIPFLLIFLIVKRHYNV